jgi:hypothetical protein
MSRSAPVTLARHSICADVRGKKLNLLRSTSRATQLVRKVFSQCAMIGAELLNQPVDIKLFAVMAPVAIRGQQMPVTLAITQCRVRAECTHGSLQDRLSYTVNNQRTNHIFNQRRSK